MKDSSPQKLSDTIESIFGKNDELISEVEKKVNLSQKKRAPKVDVEFALTLILVELASADNDFAPEEYDSIVNGLNKIFGTSRQKVDSLITQAKNRLANFRGTSEFAQLLREETTQQERDLIFSVIDEVINADGIQDGFEIYHRHRFASLLGVEIPKEEEKE